MQKIKQVKASLQNEISTFSNFKMRSWRAGMGKWRSNFCSDWNHRQRSKGDIHKGVPDLKYPLYSIVPKVPVENYWSSRIAAPFVSKVSSNRRLRLIRWSTSWFTILAVSKSVEPAFPGSEKLSERKNDENVWWIWMQRLIHDVWQSLKATHVQFMSYLTLLRKRQTWRKTVFTDISCEIITQLK